MQIHRKLIIECRWIFCRQSRISQYLHSAVWQKLVPGVFTAVFFFPYFSLGIELSNDPMETKVKSAPANIMFVLDNSGSMDWEVATSAANGGDGTFVAGGTTYEYLYSNSDNTYSSTDSNGTVLTGANRGYWKSQWHKYNRLYYNPSLTYKPWPGKNNITLAELKAVRSNPQNATPTADLTGQYLSVDTQIIDNTDNNFTKSNIGWTSGTSASDYGSNFYRTDTTNNDSNHWAKWQTQFNETGNYLISAWWVTNSSRRDNVAYEINRNGSALATESPFDQRSNGGQWIDVGTYSFSEGDTASVLLRTTSPGSQRYSADAIRFIKVADPIVISMIHYYTWADENSDGVVDNGEIYLVDINWTDANSNDAVDEGELIRNYYNFLDYDNDSRVEVGEIFGPLAGAVIPDSIKAKRDLEGGGTEELTVSQEALNFANWFGYFRRRAMAAKYAVSAAIGDFTYVNVGLYTINNNSDNARIPVQPVHTEIESLVVDNSSNLFTKSSNWSESGTDLNEYLNSSLATTTNGAWARWTPNIPENGQYRVYAWWVDYNNARDKNACYKVQHAGGTTACIRKDQTNDSSQFNLLGTYTFNAGTGGYVQVERNSPNGDSTSADAIMFEPVSGGVTVDETDSLRTTLYGIISAGGTPLRTGFYTVGRYFDVEDTGGFGTTPFANEEDGGACQQAFAIVMTDGYYNDSFSTVGNTDSGMTAPYGDTYSNTLADVAMKFYNTDLADNLPDQLPKNNIDSKTCQHLVTYTVAFGVDGTIPLTDIDKNGTPDPENCRYADDPYFLNNCTPKPAWPNPGVGSPEKIDDLWHASVNGRGQFFNASSPDELVESLKKITKDISERKGSGSSVSVNSEQLTDGTMVYQATYESGTWIGNVAAYPISKTTGLISNTANWQAASKLESKLWSDRRIFTSNGDKTGSVFDYVSLSPVQQSMLGTAQVVDYVRGYTNILGSMRIRDQKLGDIVHSSPLLTGTITDTSHDSIDNDGDGNIDEAGESVGGTIFAGANDGMLHAFNAQTGEERFAFIPSLLYGHLADLIKIDYDHRFYVDGPPFSKSLTFAAGDRSNDGRDNDGDTVADEPDEDYSDGVDNNGNGDTDEITEKSSMTMLVGGFGRGGKGYYALDITLADHVTVANSTDSLTSMFKWEYPRRYFDGTDNDSDGQIDEADEATLVSGYVYRFAGDQRADGVDNDGDGFKDSDTSENNDGFNENYSDGRDNNWDGNIDEEGEMAVFRQAAANTDGIDNDGDGTVDEADELSLALAYRDDDLGYSFSKPFIVKGYHSKNPASQTDHPWIVIFGNGYESHNGHAVLYILNALNGELIRKIDTGAGGNNGLSTPSVVDINDDERADFVYAGDLLGNMWKFDLTSSNPANWRVAHENSSGVAQPMFSAPGQPITSKPDVLFHCSEHGYMVTFGTGKFLGETDRSDSSQQTIFGIWDYGDTADHREYPGAWDRSTNSLLNLPGVKLQKQALVDERYSTADGSYLRTVSGHEPHWYLEDDITSGQSGNPASMTAYDSDGIDNDNDGRIDETTECDVWDNDTSTCLGHSETALESVAHVGWYFDLPGIGSMDARDNDGDAAIDETGEQSSAASERVVKDVRIRDGKLIVLTFIPDDSPCSGGGYSILHEFDACSGSRLRRAVFDINLDKKVDDGDLIEIAGEKVSPTGKGTDGLGELGDIVNKDKDIELKLISNSKGAIEVIVEKAEQLGMFYWREVNN